MSKRIPFSLLTITLTAIAYYYCMQFLYSYLLGVNEFMEPSTPWFSGVLGVAIASAAVWPVRTWTVWTMFTMAAFDCKTGWLLIAAFAICIGSLIVPGAVFNLTIIAWPVPPEAAESLIIAV